MRTIHKYPLNIGGGVQLVSAPKGAKVISAKMQHGVLCVWAIVDTAAPIADLRILIAGTGHPLPADHFEFVDSVFDGPFVWHVFAGKDPTNG